MLPDRTIFPSCSTSVTSSARHESYCRNSTKGGNDKVLQGGPAADRGRVRGIVRQAAAPGRHPAAGAHRAPPRRARGIPTLGARPAERCVQLARRIASVVVLLDRALARAHCPGQRAGGARRPGRWLPLALPRRRRRLLRRPGAGAAPRADVRGGVRPRHARHRARIRVPRPRQTALVPTADEDCRRRLPHARGWGVRCARLVHGAGGRITRQRARRRAGGGSRRVDRVVPDARGRDRRDAWRGGSRRVHLLRARRPSAPRCSRPPPGAAARPLARAEADGRGGGVSRGGQTSSSTAATRSGKVAASRCSTLPSSSGTAAAARGAATTRRRRARLLSSTRVRCSTT